MHNIYHAYLALSSSLSVGYWLVQGSYEYVRVLYNQLTVDLKELKRAVGTGGGLAGPSS